MLDDDWGGIIQPEQFVLIRQTLDANMDLIRPNCVALVDAFDIPDNVLNSTIGRYDGNVYEALVQASCKSSLNRKDPFEGYEQYLKPLLDKDFLKVGNSLLHPKL